MRDEWTTELPKEDGEYWAIRKAVYDTLLKPRDYDLEIIVVGEIPESSGHYCFIRNNRLVGVEERDNDVDPVIMWKGPIRRPEIPAYLLKLLKGVK